MLGLLRVIEDFLAFMREDRIVLSQERRAMLIREDHK